MILVRPISLRGVRMGDALIGRRIVVPETRELDVFARMLEQHGAITIRCPMVAINDVVDAAPVVAWLRRFTSDPPNDLILMTHRRGARASCGVCAPRRPGGGVHGRARQSSQDHARPQARATTASAWPAAGPGCEAADNRRNHRFAV